MTQTQKNNPLHGLTLQNIVESLEAKLGFEQMGKVVRINCFTSDPSVKSSLKFLRKTPWAREKVEQLYLQTFAQQNTESQNSTDKFVWPDISKK